MSRLRYSATPSSYESVAPARTFSRIGASVGSVSRIDESIGVGAIIAKLLKVLKVGTMTQNANTPAQTDRRRKRSVVGAVIVLGVFATMFAGFGIAAMNDAFRGMRSSG